MQVILLFLEWAADTTQRIGRVILASAPDVVNPTIG
jgi:hypothetical protein